MSIIVLDKFGLKIIRENYAEESSHIEAMLSDLLALQPDISALSGVSESIAAVRKAQTDFNTQRVEYEKKQGIEKQTETASTLKKQLLELINNRLLPYLDTMKMVDATKFANLANATEEAIKTTNTAVSLRSKKKPNT